MKNKICMVTGATSGIGEATALELARKKATIVVVSRSPERCARTTERIRQETGNPMVNYLTADLSSQAQIHRLVDEFGEQYNRLNVLVNNAGGFFLRRQLSEDGIEMNFALNHLNYFLLTNLLLDTLRASAPARVVNVSSNMHFSENIHFEDLQMERRYSGWKGYGQSKLANLLFTYELARRLEGTGVTVNALTPGFVATNIGKNNGWLANIVLRFAQLWAIPPNEGAQTVVYLASSPQVEGVTGKYYARKKAVRSSPESHDQKAQARLWEISEEMTGITAQK
ncbi:MAG: SDR family oxidoreductase [Chloroflexota bacterium]